MGKYDFSSYSSLGEEITDSVSGKKAEYSTIDDPKWDSNELKFITGDEYIKLEDLEIGYQDLQIYASSSVTVNIWIKLQVAPAPGSVAYIFRCRVPGEPVRI